MTFKGHGLSVLGLHCEQMLWYHLSLEFKLNLTSLALNLKEFHISYLFCYFLSSSNNLL